MQTLYEELKRIRTIMELRNTEIKAKMKRGVPYQDIANPINNGMTVFNGDEIGVVTSNLNGNEDKIQVQLDDGRTVLTNYDAVVDTDVVQDLNSLEANDINDSGMNNSLGGAH